MKNAIFDNFFYFPGWKNLYKSNTPSTINPMTTINLKLEYSSPLKNENMR